MTHLAEKKAEMKKKRKKKNLIPPAQVGRSFTLLFDLMLPQEEES